MELKVKSKKILNKDAKEKNFYFWKKICIHPVFSNYAASKDGKIINVKTGKIRKPQLNNSGYHLFLVCDKSLERPKGYLLHRFIFEAIRGVIPEGFEINHKNSIKTDNRIKNLEIITHKLNVQLAHNQKIISINIYTNEEKTYISIKTASIELEIDASNISKICLKRKSCKSATSKKDENKYRFEFWSKL